MQYCSATVLLPTRLFDYLREEPELFMENELLTECTEKIYDPMANGIDNYQIKPHSFKEYTLKDADGFNETKLIVKGDKNGWVDFILLDCCARDQDETPWLWSLLLKGDGPSGVLREPRHTYFYPDSDGYAFYVDPKKISWGFTMLKEFFDY